MKSKDCSVTRCTYEVVCKNLCEGHYRKLLRHGDPLWERNTNYRWLVDRLNLPFTEECVLWPFAKSAGRYGSVSVEGRLIRVSHVVLEVTGSPRPEPPNDCALHSCDTPLCFNPRHLRWDSQEKNIEERVQRGRSNRKTWNSRP